MIIGKGLIATSFKDIDSDDIVVFASGVSHSKTSDTEACDREWRLLDETIRNNGEKLLVYFSTYSINDPEAAASLYVKHKLRLEDHIARNAASYLIVRTGNIVGSSGNSNTIFNYLKEKISREDSFDLWVNAARNFLDAEHLALMVGAAIKMGIRNQVIYVLNPTDSRMSEVVERFEEVLEKRSLHRVIEKGGKVVSDKTLSEKLFRELGLEQTDYIKTLIKKYAAHEAS